MAENLAQLFRESAEKFRDFPAFFSKDSNKNYQPTTYAQLYEQGVNLAEALIELGVQQRQRVGLLADNRIEWMIADYGVILAGAADVPRGTDITDSEIVYILNHSEVEVVFIENDKMLEKFNRNKSQLNNVKTIILLDPASNAPGVLKLNDLIEKGKKLRSGGSRKAEERIAAIDPEDLFTLIYTSGTTGLPKGVMLKHSNMMHQVNHVSPMLNIKSDARLLSILPIWHVFERVVEYVCIGIGASTYYTNVRDLRQDLATVKPTFMGSAPRLWENIYNGIYTRINDPAQTPAFRRGLFKLAYFFSNKKNQAVRFLKGIEVDYTGRNPIGSLFYGIFMFLQLLLTGPFTLTILAGALGSYFAGTNLYFLTSPLYTVAGLAVLFNSFTLDRIVLSKIRSATGGQLRASISGGGALPRHVDEFFNNIGINVLEGYGMTETSPVISVRTFEKLIIGSVGVVAPKTRLQIRNDSNAVLTEIDENGNITQGKLGLKGVVFIKGPQVMKGYFKNEEATSKAISDGWMNTGDMGMINFKKTLTLTGRAKDTVVLLGGENVEPVPIENKLQESSYISQCMVIGQDQKNLGAIVVPDFEKLQEWAKENGINEPNNEKLIENPKVYDLYRKEIKALNNTKNGFKSFEQVTPFFLIAKPFEVGDELNNMMKMKRHVITEKYADRIKKIYSTNQD
ncbi:long-chain fatty acid--CoA ligase [Leptospira gomenensis]|uniref:Long-chain fatty acid--CoA ligase n=1 Tax=Leptospira gomenensis TaxID=2484974 RepID=A0A5F1YFG3_9LEPT|nr:long-chain fatty acid--CoA ligase [Leptospira gomenensis]TGK38630.1 long-chain fatty acid--CoA ligase [Leptospira gomenensis]TGK42867.1 long-chain fatty acid--CoA ligase [Leptospira gomenensis]TGK49588.1 long-chain fatty acid--CoA ligase [Leptospira gomenensis]TGK60742.1 long-chain fatty acid--CoA ligase [Leptospira gomenensis]